MAQTSHTDLHALLQQAGSAAVSHGWLQSLRNSAEHGVAKMQLPQRHDEAWRYTPVSFLEQHAYVPAETNGRFDALQRSDIDELSLHDDSMLRCVFVNGRFAPALSSNFDDSNAQLHLLSAADLPEAVRQHLGQIAEHRHIFAALNSAVFADGVCLHVPANTTVTQPIEILHITVCEDNATIAHPRTLLLLEDHASADVIERYVTLGESVYFTNALIEVALHPGSVLSHTRLQEESPHAQHLSDLHVKLHAEAKYKLINLALGGVWSRTDLLVNFDGAGATAEIDGLLLAGDKQLTDMHLDIRHNMPQCSSRETVKSILNGNGRVVFDGRILVAKDAQKTDAQLANNNLMLSRSAEVDTKPQLEIYADDVKCSHGTTVGELDPQMLFYLRSRGISETQAKEMLCLGFAEQIIDTIAHESVARRAKRLLTKLLAHKDA